MILWIKTLKLFCHQRKDSPLLNIAIKIGKIQTPLFWDSIPLNADDDEIREEYIGRYRVHFLGHHLLVPVLKVMTINADDDLDDDHKC